MNKTICLLSILRFSLIMTLIQKLFRLCTYLRAVRFNIIIVIYVNCSNYRNMFLRALNLRGCHARTQVWSNYLFSLLKCFLELRHHSWLLIRLIRFWDILFIHIFFILNILLDFNWFFYRLLLKFDQVISLCLIRG